MDDQFKKVEDRFYTLKGQHAAGRITREQFDAALKDLQFRDAHGRYWKLGADRGDWYVLDGQNWVQAQSGSPPPQAPVGRGTSSQRTARPCKWNAAAGVTCAGCIVALALGVAAFFLAMSFGLVTININAAPTPMPPTSPAPPSPTSTPLPTNTPLPTSTPPPTPAPPSPTSAPLPTSTRLPTATATHLTAPIFGAPVCSTKFDEARNTPIDPSPGKIVAAGANRIYASWSYQVPEPSTFKFTWYYEGDEFTTGQLSVKETVGTMWISAYYRDNRGLPVGSWKFQVRTMDEMTLLTDTCAIR